MESSALSFNFETAAPSQGVGSVLLQTLKQTAQFAPLGPGGLDRSQVQALCQASLQGAEQATDLVQHWLASGVDIEEVYLEGITPAARLMGQWWCDDVLDFASASLGHARLRHLLFELSPVFLKNASGQAKGLSCCVVGAFQTQHTMGSFMLSEFFRRSGWHVNLFECDSADELLKKLAIDWYDLLALSLSCEQQLPEIRRSIKLIRQASANPQIQIIAGGPLLNARPDLPLNLGVEVVGEDARVAQERALELVMAVRCRSPIKLTLVNVNRS